MTPESDELAAQLACNKTTANRNKWIYHEKPVGEWPALQVTWSEEPDERYWAFDGDIPDWAVPAGKLRLGYALISEIHAHLIYVSKIHSVEELKEGPLMVRLKTAGNYNLRNGYSDAHSSLHSSAQENPPPARYVPASPEGAVRHQETR